MNNKCIILLLLIILPIYSCFHQDVDKQYDDIILSDSLITNLQIDSTTINDLALICKCWGFVKYYYPFLDESGIDIDYELFELLDEYCQSQNATEILCGWIESLRQKNIFILKRIRMRKIEDYSTCDLQWITDTTFVGNKLSTYLLSMLSYYRVKGNYSIISPSGVIYHNKGQSSTGDIRDLGSLKQRLLLLFKYWNVIEYYYCLKQEDINWNEQLKRYLPLFISDNDYACYEDLKALHACLYDGHGIVRTHNEIPPLLIPLNVRMGDSSLVVIGESGTPIPKGSSIISIDGKTPKDMMNLLVDSLHYNYSNHASILHSFTSNGLLSCKDSASIVYLFKGKIETLNIKNITKDEYYSWDIKYRSGAIPDCQLINNVCYINAGGFVQSREREYLDIIQCADTLIMDLRFYPNEMMVPFIAKYLLPNKTQFVQFIMPNWKEPGAVRIAPLQSKSSDITFMGHIIVLVDENTFSQGEYTAMALQANPNTTTIGSETCGTDGDMSVVFLPGGIVVYFTGIAVLYPDGSITQRRGIKIDKRLEHNKLNTIYYNPQSIVKYIQTLKN